jgi:hypothetical protein
MADNAALYGFRWRKSRTGSGEPVIEYYPVASAYQAAPGGVNVDLNIGDPVKKVTDGTLALAAAGDAIFGIVATVAPYWDGSKMVVNNRLPGGTTYGTVVPRQSWLGIYLFADNIFEVVADDATTATTELAYQAFIGENADITINQTAGDTHAYPKLDISDHKQGTAQCRIVGLGDAVYTDFTGANVPILVTGNEVQQAPFQTTGI